MKWFRKSLAKTEPRTLHRIEPIRCSLYYNYVRIEFNVHIEHSDKQLLATSLTAWIELQGIKPPQDAQIAVSPSGQVASLTVDGLIDPLQFPDKGCLFVGLCKAQIKLDLKSFAQSSFDRNGLGALNRYTLIELIDSWVLKNPGIKPRLLDLGGRRRSGSSYTSDLQQCDVTVFDIVADEGVDVVGDAHRLSDFFHREQFDFVISVSVFEHILMPWKVAIELNKIMRTGGHCYIHTHQTLGMHELPWDFWRYSDTVWQGMFNPGTGFEIVKTGLGHFMQLVTVGWDGKYRGSEQSGGFESSGVLICKTGPTSLTWDVEVKDIIQTSYPNSKPI